MSKKKQEFVVYILELEDKDKKTRFYIGFTQDFARRKKEHINGKSRYTSRYKVLRGGIVDWYFDRSDAMIGEQKYKQLSHEIKQRLMNECKICPNRRCYFETG